MTDLPRPGRARGALRGGRTSQDLNVTLADLARTSAEHLDRLG
ncbi:hypothetical protein [Actinophytocola algeriensis]|uniref:Uncharacterized protein n=1 Tax=Actinophytocola algeriensis TaxID=1768010 RepID=A0A7W7Q2U0_9PSEU|nr:hypothetical protein [Actinophytocola algeriensis]MBB4905873.1 hypothetical protein [Actinophytocola algeriensis]MBE1472442.1 hypothetical protein [Actinophytocola algeriensis]